MPYVLSGCVCVLVIHSLLVLMHSKGSSHTHTHFSPKVKTSVLRVGTVFRLG